MVDVRGIRDDADVLAAATVMQINREVYVIALQELLTALHETTEVLTRDTPRSLGRESLSESLRVLTSDCYRNGRVAYFACAQHVCRAVASRDKSALQE